MDAAENFDIVFLDVMMDGIDGLETAKRFRDKGGNAMVVFVTVEADFALDDYEVEAAAFLVKPANKDKFHRTLDQLEKKIIDRKNKNGPLVCLSMKDDLAGTVIYVTIEDHYLKVYAAGEMPSPNLRNCS